MGMSLFQTQPKTQSNSLLGKISHIKSLLKGGNKQTVFNDMMSNNPQFAQFVKNCEGKSIEQICADYGINYNEFIKAIGK